MLALPVDRFTDITVEAYLKFEDDAPVKHEYYNGEIFAMAGASPNHVQISSNINRRLSEQLDNRPECRAWGSDMRVHVAGTICFYPDAVVVRNPQYASERHLMLTNPALIVEVTSPSTALYDRTTKLEAYKRMPSVQEVLIVDQHRVHVDQYIRSDSEWIVREYAEQTDILTLESIGCTLSVGDVYAKVTFTE
jgi:Uma2 family endonuclease